MWLRNNHPNPNWLKLISMYPQISTNKIYTGEKSGLMSTRYVFSHQWISRLKTTTLIHENSAKPKRKSPRSSRWVPNFDHFSRCNWRQPIFSLKKKKGQGTKLDWSWPSLRLWSNGLYSSFWSLIGPQERRLLWVAWNLDDREGGCINTQKA